MSTQEYNSILRQYAENSPDKKPEDTSSFEKALTTKDRTVTEDSTDPQDFYGKSLPQLDMDVETARKKLTDLLTQYPEIDYEQKYHDILGEIQNRPVPSEPNPLSSFAYAFGSPEKAPTILHEKHQRINALEDQKHDDYLKTKAQLLQGDLDQQVKKGNFQMALKQNDALYEIQDAQDRKKRFLDYQEWKNKQSIKSHDAMSLIKEKADHFAASFHLPDRMKLLVVGKIFDLMQDRMKQKDLMGMPVEDMPMDKIMEEILPTIQDYVDQLTNDEKVTPPQKDIPSTLPSTNPKTGKNFGNPFFGVTQEAIDNQPARGETPTELPQSAPETPYAKTLRELRAKHGTTTQ